MFPLIPVMDVPSPVLDEETRARLLEDLERFTACVPRDMTLDLRVEKCESVHEGIQTFAACARVDLLVMGSHGRSGVQCAPGPCIGRYSPLPKNNPAI